LDRVMNLYVYQRPILYIELSVDCIKQQQAGNHTGPTSNT